MNTIFRCGVAGLVLAVVGAGCNPGVSESAAGAGSSAELRRALPRCGQYIGADRRQILDMCDFFQHFGPEGDQIAIGVSGVVRYFDDAAQVRRDKALMAAPVWYVNFYKLPGDGRYHYDELHFDDNGQVVENRCAELTVPGDGL